MPYRWRWPALLALCALALVALASWATRSPSLVLLVSRDPGQWIVYPRTGGELTRPRVAIPGVFRRSFALAAVPSSAPLRVRALRAARVEVNGCRVADTAGPGRWKDETAADAAACLRAGPNEIVATVENGDGPPAVWIALDLGGGASVDSDPTWTASWGGATERPAAPASAVMSVRNEFARDLEVPPSTRALLLHWRLVAGAALAWGAFGALLLHARGRPRWAGGAGSPWPARAVLAASALGWLALFVHDLPFDGFFGGFDVEGHLAYVRFVLERRALPFADDGWQMFQPPLYYVLAAGVLGVGGVAPDRASAAPVLGGLGLVLALAQLLLVASSLRALFPGHPGRASLGVAVAAALPVMIYMHLAPGNEPLAAVLASAALCVALHLVRRAEPSWAMAAAVGVLAGLATLAKVTGLLLLAPIGGALLARALAATGPLRRARLAECGAALASFALTCGWDFLRVWRRFGTPFVGGWEARSGMGWWLDPGHRTPGDFVVFGRAFAEPLLAGFGGFWDGLYSTLFGDGLVSTGAAPSATSVALLLATIPALAIAAGLVTMLRAWVREPSAPEGMVLSLAAVVLLAQAVMALRVPSVVSIKASYGLVALVPLCAFAALGLRRAAGGGRLRGVAAAAALGAWGTVSFLAFWADPAAAELRVDRALHRMRAGDRAGGGAELQEVAKDPVDGWRARLKLAELMLENDVPVAAVARVLASAGPRSCDYHHLASRVAVRAGDRAEALAAALRAVRCEPDSPSFREYHARLVTEQGDPEPAAAAWREALAANVFSEEAHSALASLYASRGERERSDRHRTWARWLAEARLTARRD